MQSRWRMTCERGQTAVQYAGMAFFAAVLAVVLIAFSTPIGEQVACKIQGAIAELTGDSYSCSSTAASDPYQVDPSKVVKSSIEKSSSTEIGVSVPVGPGSVNVDGKDGQAITFTTYSDGSGMRGFSSTQELSGSYGVEKGRESSKENKGGEAGFEAKVSASGGVSVSRTTTNNFHCDSEGQPSCRQFDRDNSEAIEDHLDNHGFGRFGEEKEVNDEVDEQSVSHKVRLFLQAGASVSANAEIKKNNNNGGEEDEEGASVSVGSGSVGASVSISGEASYTHTDSIAKTETGEKHSTSHEFSYKGEASASASAEGKGPNEVFGLEGNADASASYVGNYKVTYDEMGNLQTITFTNVKEGQASASAKAEVGGAEIGDASAATPTVTSTIETTLDVSSLSPEQRRIAEDYVNSSLTNGALTVPQSALDPSKPSSDPFDNLLYERAQVTRTLQEGTQVTDSGGVDFWVMNWNEVDSETTKETLSVEQLGRPSVGGGERRYEDAEIP